MSRLDRAGIALAILGLGIAAGIIIQGTADPIVTPGSSRVSVVVVTQPPKTVTATVRVTQRVSRDSVARARSGEGPARATGNTVWDRLAQCESGGRWSYNGSSGYDGGLQFSPRYWPFMARIAGVNTDYAWQASRAEQIRVAEVILARQGWGAWPACSRKLGLR